MLTKNRSKSSSLILKGSLRESRLVLALLFLALNSSAALGADKYYDYGMTLTSRKEYRKAISYFDASIKNDSPQKAQSWFRKADCLELLNDRNGALAAYSRVLQLAPNSQEALFAKARIQILSLARQRESAGPSSCPVLRAEKAAGSTGKPSCKIEISNKRNAASKSTQAQTTSPDNSASQNGE